MIDDASAEVGSTVCILSGIWGGREGIVVGRTSRALTVEFTGPRFILDQDGPQEVKRLPYAREELAAIWGSNPS